MIALEADVSKNSERGGEDEADAGEQDRPALQSAEVLVHDGILCWLAIAETDEWGGEADAGPVDDGGDVCGQVGDGDEHLEEAPEAGDGEGRSHAPELGLDDDGALEFVGLFGDVEADDDEDSDDGEGWEGGEDVCHGAGGWVVPEEPGYGE